MARPLILPVVERAFVPDERKGEIRNRLRRIRGQVEGIDRMLAEDRSCLELLTQVAAVQEALRGVSRLVVRNYLERCASTAIRTGKGDAVYDELMDVVFKLTR
ncbi:MAG: transcriptional regulator [Acidobacteria bacterium]|nr:MAG: transcriptional regulator [Acidobacteriota bacterium]